MAMYALNMLAIALELGRHNPAYEDVTSKFWEHFLNIAHAMSGGTEHGGAGHRPDLTSAVACASHQTGWTALVAKLLQQSGETDESDRSRTRAAQQRASRGARQTVAV
jgi:hypothetical protein